MPIFCILFCDSLHRMCKHQCLWSYVQMKNFGLISSYREMILLLFSTFSGRAKGKLRFYSNTDKSCIFVKVLFPLFLDPSKSKHTKNFLGSCLQSLARKSLEDRICPEKQSKNFLYKKSHKVHKNVTVPQAINSRHVSQNNNAKSYMYQDAKSTRSKVCL